MSTPVPLRRDTTSYSSQFGRNFRNTRGCGTPSTSFPANQHRKKADKRSKLIIQPELKTSYDAANSPLYQRDRGYGILEISAKLKSGNCYFGDYCSRTKCRFLHPYEMRIMGKELQFQNNLTESSVAIITQQKSDQVSEKSSALPTEIDVSTTISNETPSIEKSAAMKLTNISTLPEQACEEEFDLDRVKREIDELIEANRQVVRKINSKNNKIQQLRNEFNRVEKDSPLLESQANLENKFYLYSLIRRYHLSIFKTYITHPKILDEERVLLNYDSDLILQFTIDDLDFSTLYDFLRSILQRNILEDKEEHKLLDYSLNHCYFSYDIAQLSEVFPSIDESRIAVAINDLLRGDEKKCFMRMFKNVFGYDPTSEKTSIKQSAQAHSTVTAEQITLHSLLTSFINNGDDDECDLHGKQLEDRDVRTICDQLKASTHCVTLDLRHNEITDDGAFELANMLCTNHVLRELLLDYNRISDKGFGQLLSVLTNESKTLKSLYVSKNNITSEVTSELIQMLRSNTTLTDLSLAYNDIDDQCMQRLCEVLTTENKTLKRLFLHGNKITDDSMDKIVQMIAQTTTLKSITLSDNHLSDEAEHILRQVAETRRLSDENFSLNL